jgi:hypothetical protein
MNDRERLEQLHGLLGRLERMPASPERDAILNKVRARAVDVETGERPAPLRVPPRRTVAVQPPAAAPKPVRPVKQAPPRVQPRVQPPAAAPLPVVVKRAPQEGAVDLLEDGWLLCLSDPPASPKATSRPWSAGLRG